MTSSDRVRLPPLSNTTRELYVYSGNQCAFPGCTEVLLKPNGTWNCQAAHIHGVGVGAARGVHSLDDDQLREPANLVLLCPNHHVEIDNKALEGTYTVKYMQEMKANHEERFRTALVSLERIVDSTAGVVVKRPQNLGALAGFCDNMTEEEKRQNADAAAPFVDALAKQPISLRDVIVLVLVHGRPRSRFGGLRSKAIAAPFARIEAAAQITRHDLMERVKALQDDGLIAVEEDENTWFLVLVDPTASSIGWDLFEEIHNFADGDRMVIERVVSELDFTALDA